ELLTGAGTTECELTAGLARPRGDADQLVVAVREVPAAAPRGGRARAGAHEAGAGARSKAGRAGTGKDAPSPVIAAMTRRLDLVTAVARLLLENAPLNETVALQRCAQLLAGELAAWAIVDVARGQLLRRQCV